MRNFRQYLNQLKFQIHPDYFVNQPIKKQMNIKSIQQLEDVMIIQQKKEPFQLHFYTKTGQEFKLNMKPNDKNDWSESLMELFNLTGIQVDPNDTPPVMKKYGEKLKFSKLFKQHLYKDITYKYR